MNEPKYTPAEAIIVEALKDGKLSQYEIDHVMGLVKVYGRMNYTEGRADGITQAKAVFKPSPDTFGIGIQQQEINAIQKSLKA